MLLIGGVSLFETTSIDMTARNVAVTNTYRCFSAELKWYQHVSSLLPVTQE